MSPPQVGHCIRSAPTDSGSGAATYFQPWNSVPGEAGRAEPMRVVSRLLPFLPKICSPTARFWSTRGSVRPRMEGWKGSRP